MSSESINWKHVWVTAFHNTPYIEEHLNIEKSFVTREQIRNLPIILNMNPDDLFANYFQLGLPPPLEWQRTLLLRMGLPGGGFVAQMYLTRHLALQKRAKSKRFFRYIFRGVAGTGLLAFLLIQLIIHLWK